MNLLLLGGNSQHNKSWVSEVRETAQPFFSECRIHEYDHWRSGASFINFDHELGALPATASGLSPYIIFAKSVGVVLAIRAIAAGILTPEACIFVGVPLGVAQQSQPNFASWLDALSMPVIVAQHTADPAGSAAAIQELLGKQKLPDLQFRELPGDTHNYTDFAALTQFFLDALSSRQDPPEPGSQPVPLEQRRDEQ